MRRQGWKRGQFEDFQLFRQKIMMVRIRGNSSRNKEKWRDRESVLKVGPKHFLMH